MRLPLFSVRNVGILVCVIAAVANTGCDTTDDLQPAIDKFEANRAKSQARMDRVEARYASCSVPTDRAGNEAFAEEWRKQWDDIEDEVKKLKRELTKVVKASDRHFKKMDQLARSIKSPEIKSAELGKNADLAKRWTATIKEANANVKKMDAQVSVAKDIYKVLKLAAMRSQSENKLLEIRSLNGQIKVTVAELEKVTAEGRALAQ